MMKLASRLGAIGLTAALVATPVPAAHAEIDKSENVELRRSFRYKGTVYPPETADDYFKGGTDIDFQGRLIYAMQQGQNGGVHVVRHPRRRRARKIGFIPCPGEQNDVAVVKPGLIALGFHSTSCAGKSGGGIMLIDVDNPKRPNYLGAVTDIPGGTHTLTKYPGKPIIYSSPDGIPPGGGGTEQILDVSNPNKPKVVATFQPAPNNGCHDLTFYVKGDKKLAFCAMLGETQIWDVSNPLEPVTITHIPHTGQMVYPHSVAVTFDGKYAVIGDENFEAHECEGGPTGAMWIYNIENPQTPVPLGYYSVPRGQAPTAESRATWCTAHLFNFVPGTYVLVAAWYASGMNIIDFSDMENPQELGHYMGTGDDYTNYWSTYWYRGRIYANDRTRGLDVLRTKGLQKIKPPGR